MSGKPLRQKFIRDTQDYLNAALGFGQSERKISPAPGQLWKLVGVLAAEFTGLVIYWSLAASNVVA